MAHDVFISYTAEDRAVADKVCEALEGRDIKCWIAPRDVPYGMDYEEAIVDALSTSPLLVLILSARSNAAPHVKREIQIACAEGSTTHVIPFRIEDVPYSKALRYYLGSAQWLDASTPPIGSHLQALVEHVRAHLPQRAATLVQTSPTNPARGYAAIYARAAEPRVTSGARKAVRAAWLVGGAVALLAVVIIAVVAYRPSTDDVNANSRGATGNSSDATSVVSSSSTSPTPSPTTTPVPKPPTPSPTTTPVPKPTPAASPSLARPALPLRNLNINRVQKRAAANVNQSLRVKKKKPPRPNNGRPVSPSDGEPAPEPTPTPSRRLPKNMPDVPSPTPDNPPKGRTNY